MKYQGHKNWNHWNVALWLSNDYGACMKVTQAISITNTRDNAARYILEWLERDGPAKTPDGAPYSFTTVRAAITHWEG